MAEQAHVIEDRQEIGTLAAELRRWLGSGALQSRSGAFCAWQDRFTRELAFEYPEITGYALTWLATHERPEDRELDAGFRAAEWLADRLAAGVRSARAGWDSGAVYTFDLGMVSAGLQSFGDLADDERYIDLGRSTARELAAYVRSARGLEALAPDGPASSRSSQWSTTGRAHLAKCVQCLLLAEELEAAERLIAQAMTAQQDDGRFPTQPGGGAVMLHPHLYAVEALWICGSALDWEEPIERARRATAWVWSHQLPDGGFPRFAGAGHGGQEQLDVTSQAIRATVLLGMWFPGLSAAVRRLAEAAVQTDEGSALVYQPGGSHLNGWVTMFGAQALALWSEEPTELEWAGLV